MIVRMIAAASLNGVIGQNNGLPWDNDYPEDLAFFKKMTTNSTIIMGRKTFDSIGRVLPKRRNIVLSRRVVPKFDIPGAETFLSIESAIETCSGDVWIIGGSSIYQDGLSISKEILITTIPKIITGNNLVYFPYVNPDAFKISDRIELSKEKNLYVNSYIAV